MEFLGVKYPNINAKLKGMHSKRITKTDLEDLIKQNSLKNAVLLLKIKSEIFKNSDENIDRLEIESLLEKDQINNILKIEKLLDHKDLEIFKMFLSKYEIKCVKSMFRKLFSDDKTNDIIVQNVKNWTQNVFEDIKGIETVENFYEFFEAIKRMKYNKILKKYQKQEDINVFEVENEMDKLYFETLYDTIKKEANLKKIIGSEIDLLNVLWIFRIKKYYNFEVQKLENILIKRYYKLNPKILNKLTCINSFEELKEVMQETVYKSVFTDEEDLEENIDRYLYNINKKIFRNDTMSMAYIWGYINMVEYENNDIINTIEGIRYNMEKKEILRRLVQ